MRACFLAALLAPGTRAAITPEWIDGAGNWASCAKTTTVFGVYVCLTSQSATNGLAKANHIANVVYQLLDNDADGNVDAPDVVNHMIDNKYYMVVAYTENDEMDNPPNGKGQMTGIYEAYPNSCDTPSNRGASNTDRSTWAAAKDTQSGCDANRDATTEEVLHLITEAASALYPSIWGQTSASSAGAALAATNGDCGHGYSGDYKDPSSSACTGQYAYNDETCDAACYIVEGIYWAIATYIGGLYTSARAGGTQNEWLMCTPDDGMAVVPEGVANARTLQSGSAAMYALVSDRTTAGHEWIPLIMPNGDYEVGGATNNIPYAATFSSATAASSGASTAASSGAGGDEGDKHGDEGEGGAPPADSPVVSVEFTIAGSVDDVTSGHEASLRNAMAQAAGVPAANVLIALASASVKVTAGISPPSGTSVSDVLSAVQTNLPDAAALTDALTDAGWADVVVESAPVAAQTTAGALSEASIQAAADAIAGAYVGMATWLLVVVIAVPSVLVLLVCILVYCCCFKKKSTTKVAIVPPQ